MNIRTTIALLVTTVLVAGGYILWQGRRQARPLDNGPSANGARPPGSRLTQPPLTDDDIIVRVEYQPRGADPLVFELDRPESEGLDDAAWRMTRPVPCRATAWMVNDLILAVKGLTQVSSKPLSGDSRVALTEAGLAPEPRARIVVTRADGVEVEVRVGNALMSGSHTYVFLPAATHAATLYLTADDFDSLLQRPATAYRDRHLLAFDADKARELTIVEHAENGPREYRLVRDAQSGWRFEGPVQAAADDERINEVVRTASRLWVREWLEDLPADLSTVGLAPPRLQLTIVTEAASSDAGAANTFDFAISGRHVLQADDMIYVKRKSGAQVGRVSAAVLDDLMPDMTTWRALDLLDVTPEQVVGLSIARPDGSLTLTRVDDGWHDADGSGADAHTVAALLSALAGLRAVDFLDDPEAVPDAVDPPAARVTLQLADDRVMSISVGRPTERTGQRLRFARVGTGPAIAKVRSRELEVLLGDLDAFRDRVVLNCAPARIDRLELDRRLTAGSRRQLQLFERDPAHNWRLSAPIERRARDTLHALIADLANLRAERIIDQADKPALGLDDPDVRLRVRLAAIEVVRDDAGSQAPVPEAARPQTIEVHVSRRDDRVFAARTDRDDLYELPSTFFTRLTAELIDGTIWGYRSAQVNKLSLVTPAGELPFVRRDGRWLFVPEPQLPLDAGKVQDYLERLRGMRTGRFVALESPLPEGTGLEHPDLVLRIEMAGGHIETLQVSASGPPGDVRQLYARIEGTELAFLLARSTVERATITPADFETE